MALSKLRYSVDDLDIAKKVIESNFHLLEKEFPDRYALIPDTHWGEKITLANKIIDHLNSSDAIEP